MPGENGDEALEAVAGAVSGRARLHSGHVTAGTLSALILALPFCTNWLSGKIEERTGSVASDVREVKKLLETQATSISDLKISITELKGKLESSDKAQDRMAAEIANGSKEIREAEKAIERLAANQE